MSRRYKAGFVSSTLPRSSSTSAVGIWSLPSHYSESAVGRWPRRIIVPLVTSGLVFHLDATNSSSYSGTGSTWTDLSGNGYNASLVNSVGYTSDATAGGVLTFNGSNQYVTTPIGPMSYSNPTFSYDIWFKLTASQTGLNGSSTPGGGFRIIAGGSIGHFESVMYCTDFSGTKLPYGGFIGRYGGGGSGTQGWSVHPNYLETLNVWFNFAVTHTSGSSAFYKNGVSLGTQNWSYTTFSTSTNTWFGNGNSDVYSGYYGPGRVAQIRYYNRVLSASEVLQNFESTKSKFGF